MDPQRRPEWSPFFNAECVVMAHSRPTMRRHRNQRMRCLFCKIDSTDSKSVEHVVPESLWNTKHVLPKGVVCDPCNNYFAREVEKPFLDSPAISRLRFTQVIPNKRGRVPPSE